MNDIRPIVARRGKERSPLYFAIGLGVMAVLLFLYLNGRREAALAQPDADTISPRTMPETVPELILPTAPQSSLTASPTLVVDAQSQPQPQSPPVRLIAVPSARPAPTYQPDSPAPPQYGPPPYPITEAPAPTLSALPGPATSDGLTAKPSTQRISASRLDNPAQTVPQGTLISAVLETALDSTGAGQARALVTRNVYGFDGSQLLIPRGSRLYGTYEAGVDQGQKRALIRWTRLLRPDGVTIALDSAASDPLGRAGVRGKVNSHFVERLGNALLSSTVSLGNVLLNRRAPQVVVATSGTQAALPVAQSNTVRPTLQVKPGARVSVFVEHDLDFSTVGSAP